MSFSPKSAQICVFCKEPRLGFSKTRLASEIGAEAAAGAAWAFLEDALAVARRISEGLGAELRVLHAPRQPGERFLALLARVGARAEAQVEGDLGARMAAGLSSGAAPRLALGSDSPDLPAEPLIEAMGRLRPGSAWTAPAFDGGYVALALGPGASSQALRGPIAWSSTTARADTERALAAAGVEVLAPAPAWPDVDCAEDLGALRGRLRGAPESVAPATRAWLAESGLGPMKRGARSPRLS